MRSSFSLRTAFLFGALTLSATAAHAGVPTPPWWGPGATSSTLPSLIRLVGRSGVTPDSVSGSFVVRVCRFLNPVNGSVVVVDFSSCPDLHIADAQPWNIGQVGLTSVDCTARTARGVSDVQGYAAMTIVGDARGLSAASNTTVKVYADGVFWGSVPVVAYDIDGNGGVGSADLSRWIDEFGSGAKIDALDYDRDGALGAGDLSSWLTVFGRGGSAQSSTSVCP